MVKDKSMLAVISDELQYKAFIQNRIDIDSINILCDNPGIYNFLSKKGVDFIPIEDELIKDKWQDITFWSYERALFSDEDIDGGKLFGGIDAKVALYPRLSNYLSAALISFYLANYILTTCKPEEVVIFNNIKNLDFPASNTNYFLNLFIKHMAKELSIKERCVDLEPEKAYTKPDSLRDKIRTVLADMHTRFFSQLGSKHSILVHGALSHFSDIILELKRQGKEVVVYDRKFQIKTYNLCRKADIRYLVSAPHLSTKGIDFATDAYRVEFGKFIRSLAESKWFVHKNRDLSNIICNEILNTSEKYLADISKNAHFYSGIIEKYGVEKVIINEDITALNSHMAAFFRSRGIKVYSVSHGIPSPKPNLPEFSLKDLKKRFCLSETIVQSEYEKELYIKCGWDKDHVHAIGLPRYDRLAGLRGKMDMNRKKDKKMRLLYCASGMFEDIRYLPLYPGEQYSTTSRHSKNCLIALVDAISGLDVRLIIKPHFISDVPLWKDCIAKCKKDVEIEMASASADFLDLLSQCDVLATGYSSTAVVEAALLSIPAIMIYYPDPTYLCPLSRKGLSMGVRSTEELKAVIKSIYASFVNGERRSSLPQSKDELEFLIGKNDGKNIKRVIGHINKGAY